MKLCVWVARGAETFGAFRRAAIEGGMLRPENLVLGALFLGLCLGSAGFFVGRPCSPWTMRLAFGGALALAACCSWRHALRFAATALALLLLCAWTFSYTGTDSMAYHLPMQRLLWHGWNPVFTSTVPAFGELVDLRSLSPYHTLFLLKATAFCGALVAKATGLFTADAFLGYALILALWRSAWRFAANEWRASAFVCGAFAAALAFSTKITSFLAGQVDYTAYAAFVAATLGFITWRRTHLPGDLLLTGLCLGFALLAKSTGLVCGALGCVIVLCLEGRRAEVRWGMVGLGAAVLLAGASPLLTAWINYGSPVYPEFSFNPEVPLIDITADFTGNADALSMGYLSRCVQAWFSQSLAWKGSAWWQGKETFRPVFEVCAGVGGFGSFFRLLMWGSVVALCLSRRTATTWLVLFLFVTGNLAPLKYIGYGRYFPQMWAIPFLALGNLLYAPRGDWHSRWLSRLRGAAFACTLPLTGLILLRTGAYQARQWRYEWERQARFAQMAEISPRWAVESNHARYTLRERLAEAGITLAEEPDLPRFTVDRELFPVAPGLPPAPEELKRKMPICDTLRDLFAFPWAELTGHLPHPLWHAPTN